MMMDTLAAAIKIQKTIELNPVPTGDLVDFLSSADEALANEAFRVLSRLNPLAALHERWPNDLPLAGLRGEGVPDWIIKSCGGWGDDGDLTDLLVAKLDRMDQNRVNGFLEWLIGFEGARRELYKRLRRKARPGLAGKFARAVADQSSRRYPSQISVSPTMFCQLHCEYCVSAGVDDELSSEIPLDTMLDLLGWAGRRGVRRIGFTGGEPTTYSGFATVLERIDELGLEFFMATNGLIPAEKLEAIIKARPLCVTMHLTPEVMESGAIRAFTRNARRFGEAGVYAILRCNFTGVDDDPEPFVRFAHEAGIREIRVAVPVPNENRVNTFVPRGSLSDFGTLLSGLVDMAAAKGVSVMLSKPFPICKLPEDKARYFIANGSMSNSCPVHLAGFSNNLIVYSDLTFSPCLGLNVRSEKDIRQFRGTRQAARVFKDRVQSFTRKPLLAECGGCPLYPGGRCIGACLSYRDAPAGTKVS